MRSMTAASVALVLLAVLSHAAMAEVRLPRLIADNMVIQRNAKFTVWGWAKPGEKVSVSIGDNKTEAVAAADGEPLAGMLDAQAVLAPATMTQDQPTGGVVPVVPMESKLVV